LHDTDVAHFGALSIDTEVLGEPARLLDVPTSTALAL
jgi:hypothetical protein